MSDESTDYLCSDCGRAFSVRYGDAISCPRCESKEREKSTHQAELAALRSDKSEMETELKSREYEISRMRDMIRETEHERELLERYGRELDEIGRVMGCDHKDYGYLRCVTDELAKVERLESELAALTKDAEAMRKRLEAAVSLLRRAKSQVVTAGDLDYAIAFFLSDHDARAAVVAEHDAGGAAK